MTTIIIPTYNEALNIVRLINELHALLPDARILVVDDNSPDGTGEMVRALSREGLPVALLARERKEGLGRAYRAALVEVLADPMVGKIVLMDADFSHDPKYVPQLIAALGAADVAVGSRYVRGGGMSGWELWRRILSAGGNLYARVITRHPVHDLTAGFYAMRASSIRRVDVAGLDASGYAFQIELKYRLRQAGARFKEVPIHFVNRREGESKLTGHIISEAVLAPWKVIWEL